MHYCLSDHTKNMVFLRKTNWSKNYFRSVIMVIKKLCIVSKIVLSFMFHRCLCICIGG